MLDSLSRKIFQVHWLRNKHWWNETLSDTDRHTKKIDFHEKTNFFYLFFQKQFCFFQTISFFQESTFPSNVLPERIKRIIFSLIRNVWWDKIYFHLIGTRKNLLVKVEFRGNWFFNVLNWDWWIGKFKNGILHFPCFDPVDLL